jgi:CubicO group peptidase (beta-lactamase class C family)
MKEKFDQLISYVEEIKELNHCTASALMIVKDDDVLLEHYSGTHSKSPNSTLVSNTSQFNVASTRKSYLGLIVAIAVYEGKIQLDDELLLYLDEYDKELLGKTTIRHLVTHSHGLRDQRDGTVFREFEVGESWAYRRINTVMISKLIRKLYNKSFTQVLEERVLQPLGLKETGWRTEENESLVKVVVEPDQPEISRVGSSKDGIQSNLFVSTRELAQWGQLHLNNGWLNGKQVIPEKVIELSTSIQSPPFSDKSLPLNGLFWYVQGSPAEKSELGERVPEGSYQILGITGPTILVIPKYNLVVTKMYNKEKNYGGRDYLHYVKDFSNRVTDIFN